jgi:beta-glucanase (GH16 family)
MKRFALPLIVALCSCNPNKTAVDAEFHPLDRHWGSHEPVWRDEFNGTSVDPTKWVVARYCGGYNGEEQCYTDRPSNISVGGGNLTITARVETCEGDGPSNAPNEVGTVDCQNDGPGQNFSYTSARLHTRLNENGLLQGWRGGRMEIRAKLPYGKGTWPAFWFMPMGSLGPWPRSGEIDMMEAGSLHQNYNGGDTVQANIHLCAYAGYNIDPTPSATAVANCDFWDSQQYNYSKRSFLMARNFQSFQKWTPDLTTKFHTYAMEWSDHDIRFFVDDEQIGRTLHGADDNLWAPFSGIFYLIINLAVGGEMGGIPNPSLSTNPWAAGPKAELVIDWVRIYTCVTDNRMRACIYKQDGLGRK